MRLGNRVIVHSGSAVGSDGFGYVFDGGVYHKIPQVGGVLIEDDVEIGSNVSIDRATTGNTVIGKGSKIDNLSQIAHKCENREKLHYCCSGRYRRQLRDRRLCYPRRTGGCRRSYKDRPRNNGRSSIRSYGPCYKRSVFRLAGLPHRDWLKAHAIFTRLPELQKKIRELEEQLMRDSKEG